MSSGLLLAGGFDVDEAAAPVYEALIDRPGWDVVVACADDEPVGVGALFVAGDIGYLAFSTTAPAHRGRGAHRALLAWRTREALARGCRTVAADTGERVRGEPNPSHDNMIRCGFSVVATRDNYAPIGTTWLRRGHAESQWAR